METPEHSGDRPPGLSPDRSLDQWAPPDAPLAAGPPLPPAPHRPAGPPPADTPWNPVAAPRGEPSPYGPVPRPRLPETSPVHGEPPYGASVQGPYAYAAAPYGVAPYGVAPYGTAPYGVAPYGVAPYGVAPRGPWVVPAGPGRPFHQLARTPVHRWWRPLLGTVAGVAGALGLVIVLYLIAMVVALAIGEDPSENARQGKVFENQTASLALELLSLAVLTPVVLFLAWAVQRRPRGSVTSVTGRLRGRWLLVCTGAAVAASAASFGVSLITGLVVGEGDPWAGMSWSRLFPVILVIVALVPFQAAAEEYVFRGWLLQAVGSWTLETWTGRRSAGIAKRIFGSPWPGIVVSTAAFTAGHAHRGWALVDIALFGLTAAWIAVRTGGLEAGIALHTVNNLVAFGFSAAEGTVDKAAAVTDAPWYSLIGSAAQLTVFVAVVSFAARRLGIATRSPEDPGGPAVSVVSARVAPGRGPAPVAPGPPVYGTGPYGPSGHDTGPHVSPGYGAGPYGPPDRGAGPYDGRAVPGPTPPGAPQAPW